MQSRLIVGGALMTLLAVGIAAWTVAVADHVLTMRTVDRGIRNELHKAQFRALGNLFFRHHRPGAGDPSASSVSAGEAGGKPVTESVAPPSRKEPAADDARRQQIELVAWLGRDPETVYVSGGIDEDQGRRWRATIPSAGSLTLRGAQRSWRLQRHTITEFPRLPRRFRLPEGVESPLPLHLILAQDLTEVEQGLRGRRMLLLMTVLAATVLVAFGAWALARGLFRPLRQLGEQIAATEAVDQSAGISVPGAPSELQPVIAHLNELLRRVAAAVARERRVNADIAHELRTPLAGMRSQLEFALADLGSDGAPGAAGKPNDEDLREASESALGIAIQMQELVENLLMLVRVDADQLGIRAESVELAELIDESWAQHRLAGRQRALTCSNTVAVDTVWQADSAKLRMVLSNLLGNAVSYAPSGTAIEMREEAGDLLISNELEAGTGDVELAERALEPFWRGDSARSETGLHCGLGLSIAQRLCALMGRVLTVAVADGRFTVRIARA